MPRQNIGISRKPVATHAVAIWVPLRVTEPEIQIRPPRSPDVMIGKVFDHSWELISFTIPMPVVKSRTSPAAPINSLNSAALWEQTQILLTTQGKLSMVRPMMAVLDNSGVSL